MVHFDPDLQSMQEMRDAVKAAKEAQAVFAEFTQKQVDDVVKAIADAAYSQSEHLARLAHEETGLGVAEHKKIKNEVGSKSVYESIKNEKTVGIISEDPKNGVTEVASPFGVVAGIVPVTNPTSTTMFKILISLKARNAIVISPHPSAKNCCVETARICLEAAVKAGAPKGIIGWISKPTMDATQSLMKHSDVNVILATGGGGLVRAAYSSGKPAYGVGPGNVPVYIEKTADVKLSVKRITDSKTFDNGTICASEQSVVADRQIKEQVVKEFEKNGAYFLSGEEKRKMEAVISPVPRTLNPKIVGKSAKVIAGMAGISVPDNTRLLIAYENNVGKEYPFSIEKLAPVFAFYTVNDHEEAFSLCEKLLSLGGRGHSLALHTKDKELARRFAIKMPVSRLLVNTPSALGAVGGTTGLAPSLTLGCGTFGGNITSDNVTVKHLFNKKRLAYGTRELDIPQVKQADSAPAKSAVTKEELEEIVKQVISSMDDPKQADPQKIIQVVKETVSALQN
ncbi:acetaldehyde dehydrogenase (acetylating) [Fictibacillus aquaticus]|uniref:Acetaldehyde dehydrogenase (Acetylating) n=1 Tax=Fictibacillus aquaticus TaxID=2021314 RepID=A0A235F4F0_9BACL|nr:acetaldehyde dehydrogenase (acetylating) [Fictibacillus aquaticus]OYD55953.1 acetaldehyde dehydrogenase (acetylating) [Fictibacillus aquaticus]